MLDRSRAVVRQPIELATHLGLKLYNRTFPRVEAALYLAEVIVHLQGRASRDYADEIEQVNAAIARELDRLTTVAESEARHVGKLAKDAANEVPEIRYTQAIQLDLTMRTPRARRYATLLTGLERTSRDLDRAWYAGALDTARGSRGKISCFAISCAVAASSNAWRAVWRGGSGTTAKPRTIATC